MAHAAAHIKKARSEMDQPADLKALEKAKERRRRSRERAERKRKVPGRLSGLTHPPPSPLQHNTASQHSPGLVIPSSSSSCHLCQPEGRLCEKSMRRLLVEGVVQAEVITEDDPPPHPHYFKSHYLVLVPCGMQVPSKELEFFTLSPVYQTEW